MAKSKTKKTTTVVPSTPKPAPVEIEAAKVRELTEMLSATGVTEDDVARILYVLKAQEVRASMITTVLELTDAIVKNKYEANANTNALTDTLLTKLNGVEDGATADQTAAEIEAAYNTQVDVVSQAEAEAGTATTVRRWTAERVAQAIAALAAGGGGGVSTGDFDLTSGDVTVTGEYIGTTAPTITNPSAGVYLLTVPAGTRVVSYTIFGNNNTLNGSAEFVVQIDNSANGIQRSYTVAQYIANTGAAADKFSIGTNESETFPSADVTQLLFPGMNGYGSTGYRIVLA